MAIYSDDEWSRWLLERRHGGDPGYQRIVQARIERVRDRLLDAARLTRNTTLADIGAGDGLISYGAIARIGPSLRVILTDVSAALLEHARNRATELQVHDQCTFLHSSAEKLDGIGDATVDTVTTRAVLAYVTNKTAALREFYRILRPGGRLSLAEPVFQDQAFEAVGMRDHLKSVPAKEEPNFLSLLQRWKAAQFPSTFEEQQASPLANYSERDLVRLTHQAGFTNIHLELHIDILPSQIKQWHVFLDVSPHPWAPSLREILDTQFTEPERRLFESIERPIVESGSLMDRDVIAYWTAEKPSV